MLFNSVSFLIFLPIVFSLYYLTPVKHRWIVTLASSYYFYMSWNVRYVFLILFTTGISYWCGRAMEKTPDQNKKKAMLTFTLVACLGVLFVFKYLNFGIESLNALCAQFALPVKVPTLSLLLPVGISFYTFQTLGYAIDVYRGMPAEHHFGKYAAFISFFPQLVAGPIERTENLLPQISCPRKAFNYEQAATGLRWMAWGFFKKLLIADQLSPYVDRVYDTPQWFTGYPLIIATVFFAIQIYCDFSGYSDIAIGTAKLFGVDLMQNFKSPYFARSVKDFWSRWHISLSTWFRDYVYIPLGGNRKGRLRTSFNLFITFLVSGLWHGANWTFLVWGGLHGILQIAEKRVFPEKKGKKRSALFIPVVFLIICATWVFFRAQTIGDALYVFSHFGTGIFRQGAWREGLRAMDLQGRTFAFLTIPIIVLFVFDGRSQTQTLLEKIASWPTLVRWLIYLVVVMAIVFFMPIAKPAEFVYFQF